MNPLPGEELVQEGIRSLSLREETVESLLVSISSIRLRSLGLPVPDPLPDPHTKLYALLSRSHGDGAHSRYNSLVRRIDSYCSAAACAK